MAESRTQSTNGDSTTGKFSIDVERGARLSAAMLSSGYTYNCQLCYELDVTESSLSRWRAGAPLSVAVAVRLAELLNVSVDWLVTGRVRVDEVTENVGPEDHEAIILFSAISNHDRELMLRLSHALASA